MTRSSFLAQACEDDLRRYGFTVVPFLDEAELAAVSEVLASAGHAPDDPRRSIHFGFFSDDPDWKRSVALRVQSIVGSRIDEMFDRQHAYFTMFVSKWPSELGTFSPHQDPSFVDESQHRTVTIWCPLQATGKIDGRDNGQLHLVPGSHRLGPDVRVNDTSHFAHRESEGVIVGELGVAVPTQPGQAVVFDNRTIHYSFPNRTDEPRVVLAIGLRPAEARTFHYQFSSDADHVDVHEISDDYFIDLNPLRIQIHGPGTPRVATVERPGPVPTDDLVRAWAAAGSPPFAAPATDIQLGEDIAYCFVCGGTEDLLRDPASERGGMAVCSACLGTVLDDGATAEGPAAPPNPAEAVEDPAAQRRRGHGLTAVVERASRWRARLRRGGR
jgi:hypothetical protein